MLVSFPGGKCDPTDQDVVHTALRETHEELGLSVPEEHVWGILRPVQNRVRPPPGTKRVAMVSGRLTAWWSPIHLPGGHVPSPHPPTERGWGIFTPFHGGS